MAKNTPDFASEVPDIAMPVAASTEGAENAARYQAQAGVTKINAKTDMINFMHSLGNQAVEGYKMYEQRKVIDTVREAESKMVPSEKLEAAGQNRDMIFAQTGDRTDPAFVEAEQTFQKHLNAYKAGAITFDQANIMVEKSIKEASARMPAWAGDFRRAAHEQMGLMQAYAQAYGGAQKEIKTPQQKAFEKHEEEVFNLASQLAGNSPVNENHVATAREVFQYQAANKINESILARDNTNDITREGLVRQNLAGARATANASLSGLLKNIPTGLDSTSVKQRQEAVVSIGQGVDSLRMLELQQIDQAGFKNTDKVKALKQEVNDTYDTWKKILSTDEGMKAYKDLMAMPGIEATAAADKMKLANTTLNFYKTMGLYDATTLSLYLANSAAARQQNPQLKGLYDSIDNAIKFAEKSPEERTRLEQLMKRDPQAFQNALDNNPEASSYFKNGFSGYFDGLAKDGLPVDKELRKATIETFPTAWNSLVNDMKVGNQASVDKFNKWVSNPKVAEVFRAQPPIVQKQLAASIIGKSTKFLFDPQVGYVQQLNSFVENSNGMISAKYNPITNQFEVKDLAQEEHQKNLRNPRYAASALPGGVPTTVNFPEVRDIVKQINRQLLVFDNYREFFQGEYSKQGKAIDEIANAVGLPLAPDYLNSVMKKFFVGGEEIKSTSTKKSSKSEESLKGKVAVTPEEVAAVEPSKESNIAAILERMGKATSVEQYKILHEELMKEYKRK